MVCAIFWDIDNCSPPTGFSGRQVAQAIRKAVQETVLEDEEGNTIRSGTIISFKAYLELSTADVAPNASTVELRSELQGSGLSLIDTPKSGRKNASDFMLATDMVAFAIDVPAPARIFLLSGDRDFAYGLGILRNRGYEVVLITPHAGTTPVLQASANKILRWREDVLNVAKGSLGVQCHNSQRICSPAAPQAKVAKSATVVVPSAAQAQASASQASKNQINSTSVWSSPPSWQKKLESGDASSEPQNVFGSLVEVLRALAKKGHDKPSRSLVADRLVASDPKAYEKAGVTRFAAFIKAAHANGLVSFDSDGTPGSEWIKLRPKKKWKMSKEINSPTAPQAKAAQSTTTSVPSAAQAQAQASASEASIIQINSTSAGSSAPSSQKKLEPEKASSEQHLVFAPHVFASLITVLQALAKEGHDKPSRSVTALRLVTSDPEVYEKAGVTRFAKFVKAAEASGVVISGSDSTPAVDWVQLHPKQQGKISEQGSSTLANEIGNQSGNLTEPKRPLPGGCPDPIEPLRDRPVVTSAGKIVDTAGSREEVAIRPSTAIDAELSKAGARGDTSSSSESESDSESDSESESENDSDSDSNGDSESNGDNSSSSSSSSKSSSGKIAPGAFPSGKEDTALAASVRRRDALTSSCDSSTEGQNVWKDSSYPEESVSLVEAPLEQREEESFGSVDTFSQKRFIKLGAEGTRTGEDLAGNLASAQAAEAVEITSQLRTPTGSSSSQSPSCSFSSPSPSSS